MRVHVITGGSVALQTVTEISAGDESDGPCHFVDRLPDAAAKAKMIFIRKKTISQRNHASLPTVALQEIEWHCRAVIQIESHNPGDRQLLFAGNQGDSIK